MEGKTFAAVDVFYAKALPVGESAFAAFLVGERVLKCDRKGKYLIFHLSHGKVLISHLRMEGKYLVGDMRDKHDIVRFAFTDGSVLRYNDVRKFGKFEVSTESGYLADTSLAKLGPEPWDLKPADLYSSIHRRSSTIKECLLDQKLIAGLGNIYADEVLFAARINPFRKASSISEEECSSLLFFARSILTKAIEEGGSTVRSYHPTNGVDGRMQLSLKVYSHAGEPCSQCGFPIAKRKIGGRGSCYCPLCQREDGMPIILGIIGSIASGKSTASSYLASRGACWVEADRIVHELYEEKPVREHAAETFGNDILKNGRIDRPTMLSMIVSDPPLLEKWNAFLLPFVYEEMQKQIKACKSPLLLLDVPLLLGSPFEKACDAIIGIFADEDVIMRRLEERGKKADEAYALASRLPLAKIKARSDFLLDGSGEVSALREQIDSLPFMEVLK